MGGRPLTSSTATATFREVPVSSSLEAPRPAL